MMSPSCRDYVKHGKLFEKVAEKNCNIPAANSISNKASRPLRGDLPVTNLKGLVTSGSSSSDILDVIFTEQESSLV